MFRRASFPLAPRCRQRVAEGIRPRGRHERGLSVAALCLVSCAAVFGAAPVVAAVGEPVRARVAAALIDEVLARSVPFEVVLPAPPGAAPDAGSDGTQLPALVTELRYCGVTEKGTGRFRAVLRWGALGAGQSILSGSDGCRQTLGDLAKHVSVTETPASNVGIAVADLEASWRPWQLTLSMTRALMPPAPTPPRPGPPRPLGGLESRRDLLVLPTAGLRIPTGTGEAITLHAAPSFAPDGIEVAVVVSEGGSASPPASRPATGGAALPLSVDANLALDLPYGAANVILRQLSGAEPLAIPVDREVIDLQNLSVIPASGASALVVGTATPRSVRETVRMTVAIGGAELKVTGLRADAQLENCAALGTLAAMACNARNAARNTAAAALAAALSQKYQGRLVRDLAGPQAPSIEAGGRRVELRGELTRATLGPRGLLLWGRLGPGGAATGGGH
jgi:hypothetical protein